MGGELLQLIHVGRHDHLSLRLHGAGDLVESELLGVLHRERALLVVALHGLLGQPQFAAGDEVAGVAGLDVLAAVGHGDQRLSGGVTRDHGAVVGLRHVELGFGFLAAAIRGRLGLRRPGGALLHLLQGFFLSGSSRHSRSRSSRMMSPVRMEPASIESMPSTLPSLSRRCLSRVVRSVALVCIFTMAALIVVSSTTVTSARAAWAATSAAAASPADHAQA